jgi:hypothetical protein
MDKWGRRVVRAEWKKIRDCAIDSQFVYMEKSATKENRMGHKGRNIRKVPKEKMKPVAVNNQSGGAVSGLMQVGQAPEVAKGTPFGRGGMNPSAGSKKKH